MIGWSKFPTYSEDYYCVRVQDPSNLILWHGFREAWASPDCHLSICGLQGSPYLTHSGSFSRFFFALLWQSTEFKFCSDSNFTGKLDESMCPSFQVTNSVICQRLIHVPFFLAIFYFERRNPLLDSKLKLWPAIHARRGILNVADRSMDFTPLQLQQ